jgi:ADP-ribose pyrophosphatase YjhB (NUDIX family)
MIERKHSLSYIEFIRGRYDETNIITLKKLCSYMSKKEVELIKTENFQNLWDNLWLKTAYNKSFLKEMNISKNKFTYLKENNLLNELITTYETPEWCFPKGRRNKYEKNLDCAIREFIEETNLKKFTVLDRINYVEEVFYGTNNILYKHIYWLSMADTTELEYNNDTYEVGSVGWYTIDEVLKLLRHYDVSKINLINQIYFFLSIVLEKTNIPNLSILN